MQQKVQAQSATWPMFWPVVVNVFDFGVEN